MSNFKDNFISEHCFIDVIEILEGKITVFTEGELRNIGEGR